MIRYKLLVNREFGSRVLQNFPTYQKEKSSFFIGSDGGKKSSFRKN